MSTDQPDSNIQRASMDLGDLTGIGRSADGSIRASVDVAGSPIEISIAPEAMKQSPDFLSAAMIEALRGAHDDLRGQLVERLAEEAGSSNPQYGPTVSPPETWQVSRAFAEVTNEFEVARRRLFDLLGGP